MREIDLSHSIKDAWAFQLRLSRKSIRTVRARVSEHEPLDRPGTRITRVAPAWSLCVSTTRHVLTRRAADVVCIYSFCDFIHVLKLFFQKHLLLFTVSLCFLKLFLISSTIYISQN